VEWNQFVNGLIDESDSLELMPDQELTSSTIISFRVKNRQGQYLSHEQLRDFYASLCSQEHEGFSRYRKVLIGQPVKYGDKSFIRLAIGANSIRQFIEGTMTFDDDRHLVGIIDRLARAYH
jgi:hypothetical protein